MAAHSSILAWRIAWTEDAGGLWGLKESDTAERLTPLPRTYLPVCQENMQGKDLAASYLFTTAVSEQPKASQCNFERSGSYELCFSQWRTNKDRDQRRRAESGTQG